jgi:predicted TIM-barrel fold metal-dependent hydrolase
LDKEYLVIDSHNHYLPVSAAQKISSGDSDGMNYTTKFNGNRSHAWRRTLDIENRLHFMEEAGVDMAVLEQSALSPQGLEFCREMNNEYAQISNEYPGKFIPCIHVPLDGSQNTVYELERAVNDLGLKAVSLVASTANMTLDSIDLHPLFEKINQYRLPIFVHPTLRNPVWGGVKYDMSQHVSREYDVAKATVEVLYGPLQEFPELSFIMPHHGGGIPNLKGRIKAWYEPKGWDIPEELRGLGKTPRELRELGIDKHFEDLFDKLYFDTAGFGGWMPITESATKVIRTDRICFGTDYPYEIHDPQDVKVFIEEIKQLNISKSEKQNILGGNVARLLNI